MKTCTKCFIKKPLTEFYKNKKHSDGLRSDCKICTKKHCLDFYNKIKDSNRAYFRDRARKWRKNNPEKVLKQSHKANLKHRYGITPEERHRMLEQQDHRCKICGIHESNKNKFNVDHDHKTGQIRGILCRNCNQGLGFFKDDISLFVKAVTYLKENM